MQVNITARHLDIEEPTKVYINNKLNRLTRYSSKIEEARAVFSMEKFNYLAEIILTGKRFRMRAIEKDEDLKSSFDKCITNVEKQLKKFRTRIKEHRVARLFGGLAKFSFKKTPEQKAPPRIIKAESFATKPMSSEEAALELDLFKKEFIVFRNSQDDNINVLYRRKDGNYGLIES